ncbi:hypothetical protein D3C87_1902860 [compost metagenome]
MGELIVDLRIERHAVTILSTIIFDQNTIFLKAVGIAGRDCQRIDPCNFQIARGRVEADIVDRRAVRLCRVPETLLPPHLEAG